MGDGDRRGNTGMHYLPSFDLWRFRAVRECVEGAFTCKRNAEKNSAGGYLSDRITHVVHVPACRLAACTVRGVRPYPSCAQTWRREAHQEGRTQEPDDPSLRRPLANRR